MKLADQLDTLRELRDALQETPAADRVIVLRGGLLRQRRIEALDTVVSTLIESERTVERLRRQIDILDSAIAFAVREYSKMVDRLLVDKPNPSGS